MAEVANTESDCGSALSDVPDSFAGEEYECKICYNHFDLERRAPKLLGCSHTFCQECLDVLYSREDRGWRIGCPVCRHRTPVPEHRVQNLPDNTALTASLPLKTQRSVDPSDAQPQTIPTESREADGSCHACHKVAFVTGCVCAIFSFLSMVVLLLLGLVFVHNFSSTPVGPLCLFAASALALLTLILTWLMCVLKYRHETGASSFNPLTVM